MLVNIPYMEHMGINSFRTDRVFRRLSLASIGKAAVAVCVYIYIYIYTHWCSRNGGPQARWMVAYHGQSHRSKWMISIGVPRHDETESSI